jgi:hypothetical protein
MPAPASTDKRDTDVDAIDPYPESDPNAMIPQPRVTRAMVMSQPNGPLAYSLKR